MPRKFLSPAALLAVTFLPTALLAGLTVDRGAARLDWASPAERTAATPAVSLSAFGETVARERVFVRVDGGEVRPLDSYPIKHESSGLRGMTIQYDLGSDLQVLDRYGLIAGAEGTGTAIMFHRVEVRNLGNAAPQLDFFVVTSAPIKEERVRDSQSGIESVTALGRGHERLALRAAGAAEATEFARVEAELLRDTDALFENAGAAASGERTIAVLDLKPATIGGEQSHSWERRMILRQPSLPVDAEVAAQALALEEGRAPYQFGSAMVSFETRAEADAFLADAPAGVDAAASRILFSMPGSTMVQLAVDRSRDPRELTLALEGRAGVKNAEVDSIAGFDPTVNVQDFFGMVELTPNDPRYGDQYHHPLMQNNLAWDVTQGAGVVIGIIDDGAEMTHPDLIANFWVNPGETPGNSLDDDNNGFADDVNGWNFIQNNNNLQGAHPSNVASGTDSHGAHVGGITSAVTGNSVGVSGTAGQSDQMIIKFFDGNVGWPLSAAVGGLVYAADNGAPIINTSYAYDFWVGNPTIQDSFEYVWQEGVLHLSSAGNGNTLNPPRGPEYQQPLFVVSTDSADVRSGFSNYGVEMDLSAPGSAILSTVTFPANATGYANFSGTSMATPNVAGVAALLLSASGGTLSRDQMASILLASADDIDTENPALVGFMGAGRVNSWRGVQMAQGTLPVPPPYLIPVSGLPGEGEFASELTGMIRLEAPRLFDTSAIEGESFRLIWAGLDGIFGNDDDVDTGATLARPYRTGSNFIDLAFPDAPLLPGDYRFVAIAAQLLDPFDTELDGNQDGTAGDDFVRNFTLRADLFGVLTEARDGSNTFSPLHPPVPATQVAVDLNANTTFDPGYGSFVSPNVPVVIPSASTGTVSSTVTIPDIPSADKLTVRVNLTHTWMEDLIITLSNPAGDSTVLISERGGSGDNMSNTVFDDDAFVSIASGSPPFGGVFQPETPLAPLMNTPTGGVWTLEIEDVFAQDGGILLDWELRFAGGDQAALANSDGLFFIPNVDATGTFDTLVENHEILAANPASAIFYPGPAEGNPFTELLVREHGAAYGRIVIDGAGDGSGVFGVSNPLPGVRVFADFNSDLAFQTSSVSDPTPAVLPSGGVLTRTIPLLAGDTFGRILNGVRLDLEHADLSAVSVELTAPSGYSRIIVPFGSMNGTRANVYLEDGHPESLAAANLAAATPQTFGSPVSLQAYHRHLEPGDWTFTYRNQHASESATIHSDGIVTSEPFGYSDSEGVFKIPALAGQSVSLIMQPPAPWTATYPLTGTEPVNVPANASHVLTTYQLNLPGDYSGDGCVGLADFFQLAGEWGTTYTLPDFFALASNWGNGC